MPLAFIRYVRRRGGHPDQGLPGEEGPVDPGYGVDEGASPGQGLPGGGEGIWGGGGFPDQGLPVPPGLFPPLTPSHPIGPAEPGTPPGSIWPPVGGRPVDPGYGVDEGARPGQGLPPDPAHPDQGLPGGGRPVGPDQGLPGQRVYWMIAYCPSLGWRYVAVDPTARPSHPIAPGGPARPQPK